MQHNRFIDVLKGFCMLMVVATHYAFSVEETKKLLFPFWVDMAVPIFMIISGFVYFKSFERRGINSLEEAYRPQSVVPKMMRYTCPFVLIFVFQLVLDAVMGIRYEGLVILKMLFTGAHGPGSYYYPVMMQFIFLYPIIFLLVKRNPFKGLLLCGAVNLSYEVLKWAYGLNETAYRLLVFRYILVIAYGCYLATAEYKPKKWLSVASFVVGLAFILATGYGGYQPVTLAFWTSTCFVAVLYVMPLAMLMITKCHFGFAPLELLGKASYHIFLVQMVYYTVAPCLYDRIASRPLQFLASMAICLVGGVAFYYLESPLSNRMIGAAKKRLAAKKSLA